MKELSYNFNKIPFVKKEESQNLSRKTKSLIVVKSKDR